MSADSSLTPRLQGHLAQLYPSHETGALMRECLEAMRLEGDEPSPPPHRNLWDARDAVVITYADTIRDELSQRSPLRMLQAFAQEYLRESVTTLHLLPFFPWSSDDGFSVMDYTTVNPAVGDWPQIQALTADFKLMGDLVINHCSSRSRWFENFMKRVDPGQHYFVEANPSQDLGSVVRPRTSPLLKEVQTADGIRHVWCTFSHDQIDLDFRNPAVLVEFIRILRLYLDQGLRWFRLDAVAFLWKVPGSSCINLPQTHELIRLLRLLLEHAEPESVVITETNIPNAENLTYFGNANEAHLIYNFSLPPLLLHALVSGQCQHLKRWLMSMPPAQFGTAYFNFIGSHDGIGLRPAEGLLSDWELRSLIDTMQRFGGRISYRTAGGQPRPYEINIALWDALSGTIAKGPDAWQLARYLCAHTLMLGLEGIPGLYIHSLLATRNDLNRVEHTGQARSINRHLWTGASLNEALSGESHHATVFTGIRRLLGIRRRQTAFHPNATQFLLHTDDHVFAVWRQSTDRRQSIFAIHNLSDEPQPLNLGDLNLIATDEWTDLLTDTVYPDRLARIVLAPYQCLWLSNRRPGQGCALPQIQLP